MKLICTICLVLFAALSLSQEMDADGFGLQWKTAKTDLEKVCMLRSLMQRYNGLGMSDSSRFYLDEIGNTLEQSSDVSAKIEALNAFGIYWFESIGSDPSAKLENCLRYFGEALELARSNKDVIREAWVHYNLSLCWRLGSFKNMHELDEAQKSMSIALEHPEDDSLYVHSCIRTAIAFKWVQNNYEQALRCLDKALVKALETENPSRLRSVYRELSLTYNQVNNRVKAEEYIDKMSVITKEHYRAIWDVSDMYMKGQMIRNENLEDHDYMNLLRGKAKVNPSNMESWKRSTSMLEKAYQLLADSSLGIHWTIQNLHANLFWNYFWLRAPEKIRALHDLDSTLCNAWQNKYESRNYIFRAAEYYLAGSPARTLKCLDSLQGKFINSEFHLLYFLATQKTQPADSVVKVLDVAYQWYKTFGNPKVTQSILLALDSMYRYKGDFRTASNYLKEYVRIEDSLQQANSEKALWALQLSNMEKVLQVEREKELKSMNRRHSLQYIGIVVGIITAFVLLAILGLYRVRPQTIKILGFFAFLLFFEFIFLLLKKYFNPYTNGEPLKELVVMLALAAIIIPLHTWMDHRVFHYLTRRKPARASTTSRTRTHTWDGGRHSGQVKMSITSVTDPSTFSDKDQVVE